ncbi:MAG: outer membrane beta-barrel protein [Bacteroidota bacterium]
MTSSTYTSFHAGFFSEIKVSEVLFIAPEVMYSLEGGEYNIGFVSGTDRISFINVPILLKFYLKEWINIHFGPQLGFLIKAESEVNGVKTGFTDEVENLNGSFDFGLELNSRTLNFGFRYIFGLT